MSEESPIAPGRTWIDQNLSQAETERLVADLMELSASPTANEIREIVREMKGTAPSERSCLEWKRRVYVPYYLRSRRLLADRISAAQSAGGSVDDATRALLSQQALDIVLEGDTPPKLLNLVSVILARNTEAAQAAVKIEQRERDLVSKIEARDALIGQYERKETEWNEARAKAAAILEAAVKKGGVTKETRDSLRRELQLM